MNTDPLYDSMGECTPDEIEDNFCLPYKVSYSLTFFLISKDLTFSDEVWNSEENERLTALNEYIDENYIFKKKFIFKKGWKFKGI